MQVKNAQINNKGSDFENKISLMNFLVSAEFTEFDRIIKFEHKNSSFFFDHVMSSPLNGL